jgi:hypothetical protein
MSKRLSYDTGTIKGTLQPKKKQFDSSLVTKEEIKID